MTLKRGNRAKLDDPNAFGIGVNHNLSGAEIQFRCALEGWDVWCREISRAILRASMPISLRFPLMGFVKPMKYRRGAAG
jgi:hypothetical protein